MRYNRSTFLSVFILSNGVKWSPICMLLVKLFSNTEPLPETHKIPVCNCILTRQFRKSMLISQFSLFQREIFFEVEGKCVSHRSPPWDHSSESSSFITYACGEKSWLQRWQKCVFTLPPARNFGGKWVTTLIHERNFRRTISEDEKHMRGPFIGWCVTQRINNPWCINFWWL